MIPLLKDADEENVLIMQNHLYAFSTEGLRTLVVAKAELDPEVYRDWNKRFLVGTASRIHGPADHHLIR